MFPECREGWRDGVWAVRLEGRERNVLPGRTECGGPWFTQIRTGVFPPRQAGAHGGRWAGRYVSRFPPREIFWQPWEGCICGEGNRQSCYERREDERRMRSGQGGQRLGERGSPRYLRSSHQNVRLAPVWTGVHLGRPQVVALGSGFFLLLAFFLYRGGSLGAAPASVPSSAGRSMI